jgi:NAD(P) transhydrogenase subunit alpha
MPTKIAVLKETRAEENRVAMIPSVAAKLEKLGVELLLQKDAGLAATYADDTYGQLQKEDDPAKLVADADIVLSINPPTIATAMAMKPGSILISFLYGINNPDLAVTLRDRKITALAMEQIPRISRAQAMDALSSQATLAGYFAPLLGATHLPRILPMMTTAVGSLRAAKVLVMGLGVAGLQALATAHRLGAVTEGYDVRPETKEQAQSLAAKFIDTGIDARGEGGYARALTADEQAKVRQILSQHIAEADMVITTASVPGRAAPRLIDAAQVAAMKPGSVIVDLGAEGGGNCEGTRPGETVKVGPATIIGPVNVPSMLAQHASELYAKNVLALIQTILKDQAVTLDFADEIIAAAAVTHAGEIRQEALRQSIGKREETKTVQTGAIS